LLAKGIKIQKIARLRVRLSLNLLEEAILPNFCFDSTKKLTLKAVHSFGDLQKNE
jgi:hypothetical protein